VAWSKWLIHLRATLIDQLLAWPFWAAMGAALMLSLCSQVTLPSGTETSVFALLLSSLVTKQTIGTLGALQSAEYVLLNLADQQWFVVILPVIAGLPVVYAFYDEWFGGYYYLSISRQSRKSYWGAKVVSAGLSGGLAILGGICLYGLLLTLGLPSIQAVSDSGQYLELYGGYGAMCGMIRSMIWNIVAISMLFPLVSLILVVLLREKFLPLTIPMMLQYLFNRLTDLYNGIQWQKYLLDGDIQQFTKNTALCNWFPSNQLTMYSVFSKQTGLPLVCYYLILLAVYLLMAGVLYGLMERRVRGHG
jgi:hypothetical protein